MLFLLLVVTACQPTKLAATERITITIAGATAMRPVLVDLTKEFSRQHPHLFFDIVGGDSTMGETRVQLGQVDLAASTLISPTAVTTLEPSVQTKALQRIPIGLDGIVLIVHPNNPIADLSLVQTQDLYGGRIWNWQALNGSDEPVLLVVREDGSGTRALFEERVMGETPVALTAVVMPTSEDVVDYVAHHPTAIGYVSRAYVIDQLTQSTSEPPPIRVVSLEGQLPTAETLRAQTYFLIQPLYLVSSGQPRSWAKQFIDFALSPAGQAIVARYHLPIR
ncbi:MAG: phosphate ABC transporter substrate-binding protein [Caldilineaceae bacterium]|nr:phosphate ABC transporter substrate-binding protein [Caldilineaceae bacterium]